MGVSPMRVRDGDARATYGENAERRSGEKKNAQRPTLNAQGKILCGLCVLCEGPSRTEIIYRRKPGILALFGLLVFRDDKTKLFPHAQKALTFELRLRYTGKVFP